MTKKKPPAIYTIGHSNQAFPAFLALLESSGIGMVVDVRSRPASRFAPWANKKRIQENLEENGIKYTYLGDRLGGMPDKKSSKKSLRKEEFKGREKDPDFREGLDELEKLAGEYRVAIMCAEKAPSNCHRGILITPELIQRGTRVIHILKDGTSVDEKDLRKKEGGS